MQRPRSYSMTGEQKAHKEWADAIRNFKPMELRINESYLKEKILKNSTFIKSLFQNKDYACLQKILQTHFVTFRQRMLQHGTLQRSFTSVYRENHQKQQQVKRLRELLKKIEFENERLKSNIIQKMQKQVQNSGEIVIMADQQRQRLGDYDSFKVGQLEKVEDSYVGYRGSDLPRFQKLADLVSYIRQSQINSLSNQPSSGYNSKGFQEKFGKEVPKQKANQKYLLGRNIGKQQSNIQGAISQNSKGCQQRNKQSHSMPKIQTHILESVLPGPVSKIINKPSSNISSKRFSQIFGEEVPQEMANQKYFPGKNDGKQQSNIQGSIKIQNWNIDFLSGAVGVTHRNIFRSSRNPQQKGSQMMEISKKLQTKKLKEMEQIKSSQLQSKFNQSKNLMLNPHDPDNLHNEPSYKKDMKNQKHLIFKDKDHKSLYRKK